MILHPRSLTVIVAVCLFAVSNAQLSNYHYSVAYFGNNLWNEGLNLGIEKLRSDSTKTTKRGNTRQIQKSHAGNIGFYNDTKSHLGLFVNAGWSKRKIFNNRFNFTTAAQPLGLYRSFLPETFKVEDNGEVKKVFLPGRFYLAPSVSAGIGRVGKNRPDNGWYSRVNLMLLFPYSRAIVPLVNVEFGYHFKLNTNKK